MTITSFIMFVVTAVIASQNDIKIVGGRVASLREAPFLVSVQSKSAGHFCGGSVLTLMHVLTSCHCVAFVRIGTRHKHIRLRKASNLMVKVGSEDIFFPEKGDPYFQRRFVRKVAIHPKCDYRKILSNDFGIIYLASSLRENEKVKPFNYLGKFLDQSEFEKRTQSLVLSKNKVCYVAGWGSSDKDLEDPNRYLKAVRMKIISDKICSEKLGRENEKFSRYEFGEHAQMCSLPHRSTTNESDCLGDSGGPFFCGRTIYGIVSYGFECGNWDTPNVYAKLSYAMHWINSLRIFHYYDNTKANDRRMIETNRAGKYDGAAAVRRVALMIFSVKAFMSLLSSSGHY